MEDHHPIGIREQYPLLPHTSGAVDRFADVTPAALIEQEKESVVRLALSVIAERQVRSETFSEPRQAEAFLRLKLAEQPREVFATLFLTNRHTLIAYEELFFGTIDGAAVHPRVVAQRALAHNAAAVIFAHNHPSGIPEPSRADAQITRRLTESLGLFEVRVVDHFIIGSDSAVSLAERGLL